MSGEVDVWTEAATWVPIAISSVALVISGLTRCDTVKRSNQDKKDRKSTLKRRAGDLRARLSKLWKDAKDLERVTQEDPDYGEAAILIRPIKLRCDEDIKQLRASLEEDKFDRETLDTIHNALLQNRVLINHYSKNLPKNGELE